MDWRLRQELPGFVDDQFGTDLFRIGIAKAIISGNL